jgi:tetrahydromethanopterin S-methyltransferase subunit C
VVDAEQSTLQLVMEQVEELIVTLIEEIRERPGVAAAILAAVVGAIVGSMLANRGRRRVLPKVRAPKQVRGIGDVAELAGLGLKLLENPLVRGVLVAQLKRRLPF